MCLQEPHSLLFIDEGGVRKLEKILPKIPQITKKMPPRKKSHRHRVTGIATDQHHQLVIIICNGRIDYLESI